MCYVMNDRRLFQLQNAPRPTHGPHNIERKLTLIHLFHAPCTFFILLLSLVGPNGTLTYPPIA